jgi:rubredoxin
MPKYKERVCPQCGNTKRMHSDQVFCSHTCGNLSKRTEKIKLWLEGSDVLTTRGKTGTRHWIRDYLLEECGYKCSKCGWGEINPYTGKIPLELEHIDGDFTNNTKDNLEILCPNCHSLTSTYKGANKKAGRPRSKYYRGT